MSEKLPSGPLPPTIAWTLFENRHAVGSTYGVQTVGALRLETPFSVYCDEHKEMVAKVIPKEHAPAIVHGHSRDNLRSQDCLESISCLALDCDGYGQMPYNIMHDLSDSGLAAMIQVRQTKIGSESLFKFHVVLPISEAIEIDDVMTPNLIRKRNLSIIQFLEHRWGCVFDRATASPIHLLHPYTKRAVTDELPTTITLEGNGLDLRRLLRLVGFQEEPSPSFFLTEKQKATATRREVSAQGNSMLQALHDARLVIAPKGDAFLIECPCGHDAKSKTKTIYYPASSKIVCFAEKCSGRPLSWFIRHMEPEQQATALSGASAILRAALLNACSPKIDQPTAQTRIVEALRSVRPADRKAVIVRVTTGAGKSFATAQHLSGYSAAHKDPDEPDTLLPGKHAILATPTNQLLREIKQRITIPHVQRTGVLAVLRDDGSAACQKFEVASKLQKAGGDVHRLLCAKCGYKDGCEAISGAKIGQGSLTLTNHALLPTVANEQHENGGFPLIVWDETPQMITTTEIKYNDIVWLREQFDIDSSPVKNVVASMVDPVVFGDKYRIAMRPMLDLVSRLIEAQGTGLLDMPKEADAWKVPHHTDSVLGRAEAMVGVESTGTAWERIRRATTQAKRANSTEIAFDVMRPASQTRILRAEAVLSALHALAAADTATVHRTLNGLYITCLTANGVVWRDHGGIILDATAPLAVLQKLRPDAEVVDLRVQDSGEVERLVVYDSNVSRTAWVRLSRDPERAQHEAKRLARRIRSYLKQAEKRLGRKPKTVVFTYKDSLPGAASSWARLSGLADEVDWHYYGNTRGYDRWFQEGFDVFITVGDPIANIGALAASWSLLNGEQSEEAFHTFVAESAENESAQAHGRSRDPQRKKSDGYRLHVHFGTRIPLGWDLDTASIEPPES